MIEEPEGNGQPITDSEDEKARKVSERAAKRKVYHDNFRAPVRKALAAGSAAPSLLCPPVPAPSSRPGSPTPSPSCPPIPGLSSRPPMLGSSSRPPVPSSLSGPLVRGLSSPPGPTSLSPLVPAPLSPPVPPFSSHAVLDLAPTRLTSSALRIFKRVLSDEPLGCRSISLSPAEPLRPSPTFGPLLEKSNHKRSFNTTFINSRPLVGNHVAQEVDLSFGECGLPAPVKLNRS